MKKLHRRIKHFLFAHKGNRFRPGVFARESVGILVLGLILIEGVYFFGTNLLIQNTGFTAAVLPAALTELTNNDRIAVGNRALTHDPLLAQAAQKKAEDMAGKGYFAHIAPDGKTPWYWFELVGYKYTYAGENLAVNFTDSIDIEEAWMNSPEHHANIVKPEYTQIGIGTAHGMYQGQPTIFVAEFFAALPSKPAVATAPKDTPMQRPVVVAAKPPAASEQMQVLGAQVGNPPESPVADQATPASTGGGSLATIASSPNHLVTWIFGIFAVLVALLLALAIFAKRKVHYLEAAGGAILIGAALGLILLNGGGVRDVQLPNDAQAASVSLAL